LLQEKLLSKGTLNEAIVRMVIEYPRDWEPMIDESALRKAAENAFEFHLVKRPQIQARVRLPEGKAASSMGALELLDVYWDASEKDMDRSKKETLNRLAKTIMDDVNGGE
jgi:exonuclease SbcD